MNIKAYLEDKKLNEVLESETTENTIKISDDVVSIIAGKAVSEVEGVSSMAGGFAGGITEVLSGKKNFSKGIKVEESIFQAEMLVRINNDGPVTLLLDSKRNF